MGYGNGTYGSSEYGDFLHNEQLSTAENEWDNGGIAFAEGTNTYGLVSALLHQAARVSYDAAGISSATHIDTASGEALDKIARLVQLDRKDGESDAKFRARIKVKFRVGNMGTTFDEFSEFTATVLDTDVDNVAFALDGHEAAVQITADSQVYDNSPMTRAEVKQFLEEGVPAGHEVVITEAGTFLLKVDGEADTAENGLTSDSISTGGTLASDVI